VNDNEMYDKQDRLLSEQHLELDELIHGKLKDQLSRFTVPEPDHSARIQLIERMKAELSIEKGSLQYDAPLLNGGFIKLFVTQLNMFSIQYWIGLLLIYALGMLILLVWPGQFVTAEQALNNFPLADGVHPFIPFLPLLSAAGMIYALRAVGTPMFELELSLPSSFAHIMFSRLFIVASSNIVIGLAASYPLATAFDLAVIPFVISWLVPLLLYCSLSLLALIRMGIWGGSIFAVTMWLIPFSFRENLGQFNILSQPGDSYWVQSKLLALALTIIAGLLTMRQLQQHRKTIVNSGGGEP